ncbi:MAG: WD40 repeat domain-containing protein [Pseudomonadota bacterium]
MATLAPHDFDEHVECAAFVGGEVCFATVDGRVHFPTAGKVVEAHDGLLCATLSKDANSLLTGGEDGQVMRATAEGAVLVAEHRGEWIDIIAAGPGDAVAFASGRTAWLANGDVRAFEHDRAVEGLAFMPKGLRLACARYDGVSLHWGAGSAKPATLEWKGAHIAVAPSPDGKYIVTAMAENALHGWRLDAKRAEDAHMRMSGYPAKPRSLSWSVKGRWLASSGAPSAVCWPFGGKEGPQGKSPKELGSRDDALVVQVACHPVVDVVAVGYDDGMVVLVRIEDGAGQMLRRSGKAAVSTLGWDTKGNRLAFGCENGDAGVIDVTD